MTYPKRFKISVPAEKYVKDGVEKTKWNTVGQLVQFEDGFILELSMFPSTKFKVFPIDSAQTKVESGKE